MFNAHKPTLDELPSSKDLLRSTKIALIGAIVILVTIVLPAEYAIDPTGIGNLLWLKKMGEIKQSLAKEAEIQDEKVTSIIPSQLTAPADPDQKDSVVTVNQSIPTDIKKETMTAIIQPNEGAEIKAKMSEGDTITYSWRTEWWPLNYDAHGDGSFGRGFAQYDKWLNKTEYAGSITAEFSGTHGLFWRNRWDQDVTVTLEVSGKFENLKKVD